MNIIKKCISIMLAFLLMLIIVTGANGETIKWENDIQFCKLGQKLDLTAGKETLTIEGYFYNVSSRPITSINNIEFTVSNILTYGEYKKVKVANLNNINLNVGGIYPYKVVISGPWSEVLKDSDSWWEVNCSNFKLKSKEKVVLPKSPSIYFNGKLTKNKIQVSKIKGITFFNAEDLCKVAGLKYEYNNLLKTLTVTRNEKTLKLTIDSKDITVDGKNQKMNSNPPCLVNNKVYVDPASILTYFSQIYFPSYSEKNIILIVDKEIVKKSL